MHLALALAFQPTHQYIDVVIIKSDFMFGDNVAIIGPANRVTHRLQEVAEFGLIAVVLKSQILEFQEEVTLFHG